MSAYTSEYVEFFEALTNELQHMFQSVFQEPVTNERQTPSKTIEELDRCEDMSEIFNVVKTTVTDALGEGRSDIELGFQDLPLQVGAYHPVGTNWIIMNRRLFKVASNRLSSQREMNSFIFSIMLHEYLHSLAYLSEYQVRRLVYEISKITLGEDHPATRIARYGPWEALAENIN